MAEDQAARAQDYREREGLEQAVIPEKVMVCIASRGGAKKLLRVGSRIAGRLASDWYAVYVETPREEPGRIDPKDYVSLAESLRFAEELGAKVVKLKGANVADTLIDFARREGATHVVFGQSARSRWNILLYGSVINRFLNEVRDAEGRLLGSVALLENITHLREIDRLKSEFVNTAAHYLQTPLLNLQLGLHCLITEAAGEMVDKQKDILYACREDSERLERLMRDLTDLSRIESGEAMPRLEPVRDRGRCSKRRRGFSSEGRGEGSITQGR
ncbi:MAG TPA: histidine kinase dimerization/phospho-acceptor domain-containing protein [Blastocatellia bacterium]